MSASAASLAVGVDVGASGVRVAVRTGDHERRARIAEPFPRRDGHVDGPRLATLIRRGLIEAAGERTAVDTIAVGLAGFPDIVVSAQEFAHELASTIGARRVIVANDALTTHVGALRGEPGTVVAAGTGTVALGTDHVSTWIRADGWGLLLGDEGSGAWIGRQGLAAALRAADGRADGSPTLLEALRERFGGVDQLVREVYAAESPSSVLGGFTPAVADAARAGDSVARSIWTEAAQHLATAVTAAVIPGGAISWGGGVFDAGELILTPFTEAVAAACPDSQLVAPNGASLDGAVELARRESLVEHPSLLRVFDMNGGM